MQARLCTSAASASSTNPVDGAVDSELALSIAHLSASLRLGGAAWRASQASFRDSNSAHFFSFSAIRASNCSAFSAPRAWRRALSSATLCSRKKGKDWQSLARWPELRQRVHTVEVEVQDIEMDDMTRAAESDQEGGLGVTWMDVDCKGDR
eukprot:CAMPEP_0204129526 /NCGR_PEP_ID=MMETSP0361-20130328/12829_1 /ASSEMBLY_ACC=CAM_ASM_000343 /TAXON_ID=268821 /ORGANISM="Scrippsiella Hangoei, Strain SHTV-5" /LENGTH=150 /DNA_ID=CAMNT_0051081955 /DNA_START=374 /DNA_END=826 /DNA_ORIENTATION=+